MPTPTPQFGPGFSATFIYYFASTAIVFTAVAAQALGNSSGLPQAIGAAAGLGAGLIGAYFNRTTTFTVPIKNPKTFTTTLTDTLATLGYQPVSAADPSDPVWTYERSGWSRWFSGKIFVQLDQKTATIASRAVQIRQLRKVLS